jgi:tripartite-type tricarboxylate transporter receptor subunit TctC
MLRLLAAIVCCALSAAPVTDAYAQGYPAKPVRIVVSLAAAGGADFTVRLVAQKLSERMKQQFVVENRPGAGGAVGSEVVAKAPADGYTLLVASIAYAVIPSLHKNLPYDPVNDLTPVAVMVNTSNMLVVHPSLPVKSVKELIAFAKAHPGELKYSSSGNGGSANLIMEAFKLATGTDILHVPYRGATPGLVDLLAGRISMSASAVATSMGNVKQGKLRALATTGAKRALAAPDLPTIAEAGVPGFAVDNWYAMFAPAATPHELLAQLNGEISKIVYSADLKERFAANGLEPAAEPLPNTNAYIKAEIARWGKVVKAANITAE